MTIAAKLPLKLQSLPEKQQSRMLEFIEHLPTALPQAPLIDPVGMFAGYDTTDEEIAEARREMWGNSPREDC